MSKGIIYYSDFNKPEEDLAKFRAQLKAAAVDIPIVSVTLKPLDFGKNIVLPLERSVLTMTKQILAGLEALDTDYVFFTEDDVLYHADHFKFTPPQDDLYYYNLNCWQVRHFDGYAVFYDAKRLSQICANREFLLAHYRRRLKLIEEVGFSRKMGYEPGTHGRKERVDDTKSSHWRSENPNIDVYMGMTLTARHWKPEDFRNKHLCINWKVSEEGLIPGWGKYKDVYASIRTE